MDWGRYLRTYMVFKHFAFSALVWAVLYSLWSKVISKNLYELCISPSVIRRIWDLIFCENDHFPCFWPSCTILFSDSSYGFIDQVTYSKVYGPDWVLFHKKTSICILLTYFCVPIWTENRNSTSRYIVWLHKIEDWWRSVVFKCSTE